MILDPRRLIVRKITEDAIALGLPGAAAIAAVERGRAYPLRAGRRPRSRDSSALVRAASTLLHELEGIHVLTLGSAVLDLIDRA